jgi:hypothetical protein
MRSNVQAKRAAILSDKKLLVILSERSGSKDLRLRFATYHRQTLNQRLSS